MTRLFKLKKLNRWLLNMIDMGLILLGFYLAFMIKFDFDPPARNFRPFLRLIPFILFFAFIYINIYDISETRKKKMADMGTSIFIALSLLHMTTMATTFIFRGFAFPRSIFIIAFVLQFFGLILWKALLGKFMPRIYGVKQAMIIGDKKESKRVAKKLLIDNKGTLNIKYMVHNYDLEKIRQVINGVDVLVICPKVDNEIKSELVSLSLQENKKVYLIPDMYEIMLIKSKLTNFDDMPGLEIEALGLSAEEQFLKRAFDIVVSIISIILGSPFMILSAVLVKLSSKGPVFFKQERLTIYNRPFNLYKFRTMINDAEKDTGPTLAKDNDTRITKVGHFLRMTRLDELPQLFNVLKGDMSIVGPRPERDFFVEKIMKENAEFGYRTNVKAGITGLAQVYGKYSTSSENKLRYDLLYIRNYSFILDIVLILKTIKTMVTKASSKGIEEDKAMQIFIKDKDEAGFFEVVATSEDGQ